MAQTTVNFFKSENTNVDVLFSFVIVTPALALRLAAGDGSS